MTAGGLILAVVGGYLLGSLPVAVWVGRSHGVDPRTVGDRNPGYWNTKATFGPRAALPVFAGDTLKGAAAGLVGLAAGGWGHGGDLFGHGGGAGLGGGWGGGGDLFGHGGGAGFAGGWGGGGNLFGHGGGAGLGVLVYAAVAAAMVGHAWPVFAGFRGGRSILTFAGGMAVISPPTFAVCVVACVVVSVLWSFTIGARVGVFAVPVVQIGFDGWRWAAATFLMMSLIGIRFAMAGRGRPQP